MEKITVSGIIPSSPEKIYNAWLSSAGHSAFTGSPAKINAKEGGVFTAWDGYITGSNLELKPFGRIVQSWRTTEFPPGSEDSRLEILIVETGGGAKITLKHSNIPDGQGEEYRQGWIDYYLEPLKEYFKSD